MTRMIFIFFACTCCVGCMGSKLINKSMAKNSVDFMVVEYKDLLTEEVSSFKITSTVTLKPYYSSSPYVKSFRYRLNLEKKISANESGSIVFIPTLTISDRFSDDSTLFFLWEIGLLTRKFDTLINLSDTVGTVRLVKDCCVTKLIKKELDGSGNVFYHFDFFFNNDSVKTASYIFNFNIGFREIKYFDKTGLCNAHLVLQKINKDPYENFSKPLKGSILFYNPELISFEKY